MTHTVRLHPAEADRLDSLASYRVLDSAPDPTFDALASFAARLCDTPIAAVSMIDAHRQWFKSITGLDVDQTAREHSFCSDAVASGQMLVIPDATSDPRYSDNPFVRGGPRIRSYAGIPLVGRDGLPLGALCVIDQQVRTFTAQQLTALEDLAAQTVVLLEQRRLDQQGGLLDDGVIAEARDAVRLRRALEDGELTPHFQPLVDMRTSRPHALEALLRWQHPELGTLAPSAFLPGIESSALVVPVGRLVLDAALRQVSALCREHLTLPGGVGVNVASGQLARPGLADDVLRALSRHRVPAAQLTLEITEATALPEPALARAELGTLAAAGVHIVIDDYGVGWSNLSRVLELPVDGLKLDRSIAAAVLTDPRAEAMVASTLALARDLDLTVTAEGIESDAVQRHLAGAGSDLAQGWLFSPAVPGGQVAGVLRRLQRQSRLAASLVN